MPRGRKPGRAGKGSSRTAELRKKIAELRKQIKAEKQLAKVKIHEAQQAAIDKALALFEREHAKKEAAREKVVINALTKFEKRFAKKQAKKATKRPRGRRGRKAAAKHEMPSHAAAPKTRGRRRRRGRPAKKA